MFDFRNSKLIESAPLLISSSFWEKRGRGISLPPFRECTSAYFLLKGGNFGKGGTLKGGEWLKDIGGQKRDDFWIFPPKRGKENSYSGLGVQKGNEESAYPKRSSNEKRSIPKLVCKERVLKGAGFYYICFLQQHYYQQFHHHMRIWYPKLLRRISEIHVWVSLTRSSCITIIMLYLYSSLLSNHSVRFDWFVYLYLVNKYKGFWMYGVPFLCFFFCFTAKWWGTVTPIGSFCICSFL